jgi:hypothetical protein
MWEDPIVAEVHRIRREIMARFNGDRAAYDRYLSEWRRRSGRGGESSWMPRSPSCGSRSRTPPENAVSLLCGE